MDWSKTPVVLTTSHLSTIPSDLSLVNYQRIYLNPPSKVSFNIFSGLNFKLIIIYFKPKTRMSEIFFE